MVKKDRVAQTLSLLQATELLREEIGKDISSQQMMILFLVATSPGISLTEMAKMLELPKPSVSRNVGVLGHRIKGSTQSIGPEQGFVETRQDDNTDIRKKGVYLTERGEELVNRLCQVVYEGYDIWKE